MLRRVGLLAGMLLLAIPQVAQQYPGHISFPGSIDAGPSTMADTIGNSPQAQQMQRRAQVEQAQRHLRELHEQTDQLAALANQLKAEVDNNGSQTLSADALKKTQAIEKLAKRIRSNMKNL